jgi:hypothetical protein
MLSLLNRYWNWVFAAVVMVSVPIAGELGLTQAQNLGLWVFVAGVIMGKLGLIGRA